MDVTIDGKQDFELEGDPLTLLSVVGAANDYIESQGRAIVSLNIDGEAIRPTDVLEELGQRPVEGIQQLTIETAAVQDLVEDALKELQESLAELPQACRSLAAIFHGDRPEEGFDPFVELANIWSHVKQREAMAANALGLELDAIEVGGRPLEVLQNELNKFLEECGDALKNGDCILLGDLLEYELAPRAETEAEIVAILRDRNAATSG